MSLKTQLVELWNSSNSGILCVFVGNFQFGSNLTQKMPLKNYFVDIFILKIADLAISIILSKFRYLFIKNDYDCSLREIADKFTICSAPLLSSTPLLPH